MARAELDAFIEAQVLSAKRAPSRSTPPLQRCLLVKKVARRSPAGHAGIAHGDLLVSVNGHAAGTLDPMLYRSPARQRTYLFFSPGSQERIEIAATGIDPGLELQRTPESIIAGYAPQQQDPAPLLELWEWGAATALERLSAEVLRARGGRDHPALVLQGAALIDQGRTQPGFALVVEYARKYVSHWTTDYRAVASYYIAAQKRDAGDTAAAVEILRQAYDEASLDRVADALVELGHARPAPPSFWLGRRFPRDYRLETIEGQKRTLALADALAGLAPGRLLLVCLLDGYRSNGPYNDFMRRFSEFAAYFAPFLAGLHVITEDKQRRPDRSYWFEWEDKARAAGLPFEVMLDPDGAVGQAVLPPGSPYVVALDTSGMVRAERDLEGTDLWAALEAVNP